MRTVIENPGEVSSHLEPMDQAAKHAKRQRIMHRVLDRGAASDFLEAMRVTPQFVRSLGLNINELERWVPFLNFRQPSERNAADSQSIGEGGSLFHLDGRSRQNSEAYPRRSEFFQVFGPREEIENLRQRLRHPKLAVECIDFHAASRAISAASVLYAYRSKPPAWRQASLPTGSSKMRYAAFGSRKPIRCFHDSVQP